MIGTSRNFANEQSFKCYMNYIAMKKHFKTNYDYIKMGGKLNTPFKSFRTRPDVFFFNKVSGMEDYENILLANIISKPEVFIREIAEREGHDRYVEWRRIQESLTKVVKDDLNQLNDDWQSNFVSVNGQHPIIITLLLRKQITFETFTILIHIANIFAYWEKNLLDKIIAYDIIRKSSKYKSFLTFDEKKFKNLVRERFF